MLDRREVLGFAGRAGLVALLSQMVACRRSGLGLAPPAPPKSVTEVGLAYLEAQPSESDATTLREGLGITRSSPSIDDIAAIYGARIAADFEEGDVVEVSGWRLSRTEARIAALLTLEAS